MKATGATLHATGPRARRFWSGALRTLAAVGVALVVVGLLGLATRHSPLETIAVLLRGGFGTPGNLKATRFAWTETLIHATPILLTGLAAAWAFRAGLFNIGAEGQLLWGGLAAAWAGHAFQVPPALHIPVALAAGAMAGALWAAPAAYLKVRRGAPEVLSTLLLSFLAVPLTTWVAADPLHDPTQQGPRTADVYASAFLPTLPGSRLHFGLILGLACAGVLALVLARGRFGFQLRVVGENPEAARSSGVKVERVWTLVLLQSGALAGLAGAVEVLGVFHYFKAGFSPGYGYEGIAVAILGGNTPLGLIVASIFWGGLATGAMELESELRISRQLVAVVQALVVLAVAIRRWPTIQRRGVRGEGIADRG